ncbi:MAG: translocase [Pseudodonghicola sp.]
MSRIRLIALVGGTMACALGIGFVMQRFVPLPASAPEAGPVVAAAPGTPPQTEKAAPADPAVPKPPRTPVRVAEPLDIDRIALTSAPAEGETTPDDSPALVEPLAEPLAALDTRATEPAAAKTRSCAVTAEATARAGALVDLQISAPCQANARVVIHHHGMFFADLTNDQGQLEITIPALAEQAVFIAAFDNGDGAVAVIQVPDIGDFDRIALQWAGPEGFELHAREFGAGYDDPGHIWAGLTAEELKEEPAVHGTVVRLGAPMTLAPLTAEVYSFPAGQSDRTGAITLSVEAEITAQNCGREISAQVLERQAKDQLRTRELELAMPACDAVGDFLVLNNLLDDLKIAAK